MLHYWNEIDCENVFCENTKEQGHSVSLIKFATRPHNAIPTSECLNRNKPASFTWSGRFLQLCHVSYQLFLSLCTTY